MAQSKSSHEILLWAAEGDNSELCQRLISAQPSLREEKNQDDVTLLIHASKNGCQMVVRDILPSLQGGLRDTDKTGRTALQWAAENKHVEVVKLLLDKDKLAWVRICYEGHVEAMATLIKAGLDEFVMDKKRHTPMHLASLSGNIEMVKLLLEKYGYNGRRDSQGMTPFTLAGHKRHQQIINLFLEHGASVEGVSRKDWLNYYERTDDPSVTLDFFEISGAKRDRH
ncbi:hypothetical protein PG989_003756 [Apiospora arundinis]